ncbi:MAG: GntR family transcriptional regulator [Ilumatobacteraceae bacterium]|nr:GntR family transcriptional regulator [Ilumatobacteraceae bacterium]
MVKRANASKNLGIDVLADAPLYEQVRESLTQLVLDRALSDSAPLPTEPNLMDLFGVSRGTLRRAIEDLVRDGLLSAEQGRGTFVVQEERVRRVVWQRLSEVAKPDSRFDMDLRNFVPDFGGSAAAHKRVIKRSEWAEASVIFCAPDNSIEQLRLAALVAGKKILVPTYGLRRGFIFLDGAKLSASDKSLASTLDGMEKFGSRLGPGDLRKVGKIDLVITGATATTIDGRHIGGGQRYLALEWLMMRELGIVNPSTLVIAVVHDCQVVNEMVEAEADCLLGIICTNTQEIDVHSMRENATPKLRRVQ